ncbi:3'-5' exoribonuclease [mine drainage metagenome]|uniref:3'-5' exoribonuclease n=1 Tax=mine drainage metagenome TaxID=410659 RepID=A0A1J5QEE0_9ZZZZ
MIRIYLDCELTHLPAYPHADRPGEEPGLVSIGCASEDDQIFYAENADMPAERCNDWVIENVLTLLDGGDARMPYSQIASSLKAWIEAFKDEVQALTDAPYVDWPPVYDMFEMYGWPVNLARTPLWLWIDDGVIDNMFIADKTSRRHHALDDALMNKLADDRKSEASAFSTIKEIN